MNTTLQVRIDQKTKDEAQVILERLGLDVSAGVKVFLRQVIETQSLPFPVRTANGFTPAYEQALLHDRKNLHKKGAKNKTFKTTQALFKDLGI